MAEINDTSSICNDVDDQPLAAWINLPTGSKSFQYT
jgi:hypothetical protein